MHLHAVCTAEAVAVCRELSVLGSEGRRSDGHKSQHGARQASSPKEPTTTTEKQTAQVQVLKSLTGMTCLGSSGDLGNGEGVREGVRTGIRKMSRTA